MAGLLGAVAIPALPGWASATERHRVTAKVTAAPPEHPALMAHLQKMANGAEKEEVMELGSDLGQQGEGTEGVCSADVLRPPGAEREGSLPSSEPVLSHENQRPENEVYGWCV